MLAVHHALADAGITIAFPQVVVWSGHDAVTNPYDGDPGEVFTGQPPEPPPPKADDATPSRWAWRPWKSDD